MTKREKLQTIVKIIISIIVLAVIKSVTCAFTYMPSLVFWIVAEIFLFADGCAVYNMLQSGKA